MFPQDAMWGNIQSTVGAPQYPCRRTWCFAIEPFMVSRPFYDAINKQTFVGPGPGKGSPFVAGQPLNGQVAKGNVPPLQRPVYRANAAPIPLPVGSDSDSTLPC